MKFVLLLLFHALAISAITGQEIKEPEGGSSYQPEQSDEITPEQRAMIIKKLQANEKALRTKGLLKTSKRPAATLFQWPLKQAPGFNDNGFYTISNYVDENPAYPNLVLDYNCGSRTYDRSNGYNHKGTDISLWPFPWKKMQQNAVQIIAAAPGTIIGKEDGSSDQNCAFCTSTCAWNAVYVMHADGSVAWYGHMKKNSLTSKAVGQSVALGEYLGVVGSSGNSTGPHLHFEVYTNNSYSQLVDPWAGPCNLSNPLSGWWASQQPYYVSTLNKVMLHSAAPALGNCPAEEIENAKFNFVNGEKIFLAGYYRDVQSGQQAFHKVYRPDNTVSSQWTQNFANTYSTSYTYYSITLPPTAATGVWRYEITYNGQPPINTYFGVNTIAYAFIKSGNWDEPSNWSNNTMPPAVLPAGSEILVNPTGECVLNVPQTISTAAKISVAAGKRLKVLGSLILQ